MTRKLTKYEWRQRHIEKSMPAVKQLIKRHGLSIVIACINQIKELEKAQRELRAKEIELDILKRKLKDN